MFKRTDSDHNEENMAHATEKKKTNFKYLASRLTRKSAGRKSLRTGQQNGALRSPLKPRNGVLFQSNRTKEGFRQNKTRSTNVKLTLSNSNNAIEYRTIEERYGMDRDGGDEIRIADDAEDLSVSNSLDCTDQPYMQDKVGQGEDSNDSSDDELDAELVAIFDRVMYEKESIQLKGSEERTSLNQALRSGRQNPAHPDAILNDDTEIYRPVPKRTYFHNQKGVELK